MQTESLKIADRISSLKPTAVNAILSEVRHLRSLGRQVVSLMRGEPDFPTPSHIVQAAKDALTADRTGYPEIAGEPGLRKAIARKLQRDNSVTYNPASEIMVTDGATMGIYAALMTLLSPGDGVLIPDPIYDAYRSPIRMAGGVVQSFRTTRGAGGRFELSIEAMEEACTSTTRVLLINNPWNPVGTVLTEAEWTQIAEFVLRKGLVLISDEIYEAITYDDRRHISPVSIAKEIRDCCILVNSFSKTYSMTGWRLGYCAGPEEWIQPMLLVLQQSSRGPATFIQDAGAVALNGPQDCVEQMRAAYAERRQASVDALRGLPSIGVLAPEGGFFTIVDISRSGRSSDEVRRLLLGDFGLAVVHGAAYGPGGEGTLRVSFASGGETLTSGLELLREGLEAL